MRLWSKSFGKKTEAIDFAGRKIVKGAYNVRNSEFGWNVDHVLPQSRGGKTADYNLVCCYITTNDEKADKFPVFSANNKKFEIIKVENNYEIHQVTKETKKTKDEDGLIPLKYEIIKGCERMYRILIVEDDIDIGNVLEKALYQEGYAVTRAYSGTEAKLLADRQFDLILLDLMLPGLQGEELLSVFSDTKVIVLSAKADLDNKVHLLLNGAIDYISKPFYLKEAVARVKVALRKNSGVDTTFLTYKELKLNKENHTFFVNDHEVKLTKTEFAIVRVLMQYPERVYSKSSIVDLIVDETNDGVESSLNVHISNIRNKINLYAHENYIETIWGLGYKLQK